MTLKEDASPYAGHWRLRSRFSFLLATRRRRLSALMAGVVVATGVSVLAAGVFASADTAPTLQYIFGGKIFGQNQTPTYGTNVLTGTAADATWGVVSGVGNTVTPDTNGDGGIEWSYTSLGTATQAQVGTKSTYANAIIPASITSNYNAATSTAMTYVVTATVWGAGTIRIYWGEQRGTTQVNTPTATVTLTAIPQVIQTAVTGTVRPNTDYGNYIGLVGTSASADVHLSNLALSLASQITPVKDPLSDQETQVTGVAVDSDGNVDVSQGISDVVGQLSATHFVPSVLAGTSVPGNSGDGGPATSAEVQFPAGLATDSKGDVFIADTQNNEIREVTPDGVIHTVAGTGTPGDSGDGGPATKAELWHPNAVAVNAAGDLFIADTYNEVIREVNTAGIITTIAGTKWKAGYSGDGGPATQARLSGPSDVQVDAAGDLFIADTGNDVIREVNTAGIITTVAGTGRTAGYSGDGGPATQAELNAPEGIAVAPNGDLYIADTGNDRIRMVSAATGVISTVVGNGTDADLPGQGADGEVGAPVKLAIDPATGNLYIATGAGQVGEIPDLIQQAPSTPASSSSASSPAPSASASGS